MMRSMLSLYQSKEVDLLDFDMLFSMIYVLGCKRRVLVFQAFASNISQLLNEADTVRWLDLERPC